MKTVNLSKLVKLVNTLSEVKKTLNDYALDYSNEAMLKSTLLFMNKNG